MKKLLIAFLSTLLFIACSKSDTISGDGSTVRRCAGTTPISEDYHIEGPSQLCVNTSETYTIPGFSLAGGGFVTWSVDNPSVASITASGTSATVTRLTAGTFNVRANAWTGSTCQESGWLNDKTVNGCTSFSVYITKINPSSGHIPSIVFYDPVTSAVKAVKAFSSSSSSMQVPAGTYNMLISQTNHLPLTVSMSGFPTQTSADVVYNNITVGSSFPMVVINNP